MVNGVASPLLQVQIKERPIEIPLRFPPRRRSPAIFDSNKRDVRIDSQRQPAKVKLVGREKPRSHLKSVNLPQCQAYTPRSTKPILLKSPAARQKLSTADPRWRRVVLRRSMTENGGTSFTLGTKFGGTVTRDADEVPFSQILHYVTPSELSRFENADYEEEDEAERIHMENMKPRGRPRKDGVANGTVPKTPKPKPNPTGLVSGGYSAFRGEGQPKRRGRPVGWRKNGIPAMPGGPVPSFNGPQPTGEIDTEPEVSTREQTVDLTEKRLDLQAKTGVYSMVSASGLGPPIPDSETEMDTREPTPSLIDEIPDEPTSKRRRVDCDISSRSQSFETAPPSPKPPSQSISDEDEPLDLLDHFTSTSQQRTPSPPNDNTSEHSKPLDEFASWTQTHGPSRSTSDEDERLNLLDQFTAKPHKSPPRSHTTSSRDSMLSIVHYSSPTKHPGGPLKPLSPIQTLNTPPQRPLKRTSMTPHYPGSGGIIPTLNGEARSHLLATSPSKTRKVLPLSSTATTPVLQTIPPKQQQRQRPQPQPAKTRIDFAAALPRSKRTPRPSSTDGSTSCSLTTNQANTARALDSYFSPHGGGGGSSSTKNIDPRLHPRKEYRVSDSDSSDSDSDLFSYNNNNNNNKDENGDTDEDDDDSAGSFVGVVEAAAEAAEEEEEEGGIVRRPAPPPPRPVEKRRATAVAVVVSESPTSGVSASSGGGGGGGDSGRRKGCGGITNGAAAHGGSDGSIRPSLGNKSAAQPTRIDTVNGRDALRHTNASLIANGQRSESERDSDDDDDDEEGGSIEL